MRRHPRLFWGAVLLTGLTGLVGLGAPTAVNIATNEVRGVRSSLSAVGFGMTPAQVEAALGRPDSSKQVAPDILCWKYRDLHGVAAVSFMTDSMTVRWVSYTGLEGTGYTRN